jgi:hypothetical protein
MQTIIRSPLLILLLILSGGCSDAVVVSGKVVFSDGEPVDSGKVVFQDEKNSFTAKIREDGSFSMGQLKDGQGIPRGHYQVYIAEAVHYVSNDKPPANVLESPGGLQMQWIVDAKYRTPGESGLEYDIQKRTTGISIVVEKPENKHPTTRKN